MRKVIYLFLLIGLLVSIGYGFNILKGNYEEVRSQLNVARNRIDSLEQELRSAQAENEKLKRELSAKGKEVRDLSVSLERVQKEIAPLKEKMRRAKEQIEIIKGLFLPSIKGELDSMNERDAVRVFLGWRQKVKDSGDPQLQKKFQDLVDSGFSDEKLTDLFIYLFDNIPRLLEVR